MSSKKEISFALSIKFLSGMATPEEVLELQDYLQDPELRSEFHKLSNLWNSSSSANMYKAPAIDKAWNEFEFLTGKEHTKPIIGFPVYKYMIAASIAALIVFAAWLYVQRNASNQPMMSHRISSDISSDTLTDGSIAVLNVNSKLSYASSFKKQNVRSVTFNGEGFFNVVADKKRPFEIKVNDVRIRVIGTSFNVQDIENERIEVQVATGVVKMYTNSNSIMLQQGQTGTYNYLNKKLSIERRIDINSFAYASHEFSFNDIPFSTACTYLEKAFNVIINLEPTTFDECRISADFQEKSLEYILDVLSNTLNASYSIKKNMIYISGKLKGKACE